MEKTQGKKENVAFIGMERRDNGAEVWLKVMKIRAIRKQRQREGMKQTPKENKRIKNSIAKSKSKYIKMAPDIFFI